MAKFNVEHACSKDQNSTFDEIKNFLSKESEYKKFDAKAKVTFDESKKSCHIEGSQFKAIMSVIPKNDKSVVSINIEIPFLLMPFKGKIEETLKKMLSKHLT
jgi:hypothetical protein